MTTNTTHKPLTMLELFRKYGGINKIPHEELRAAQVHLNGRNALSVYFEAAREYEAEVESEAQATGKIPAVCFNKDGLCEDDHCRCWK